MNKIKEQNYTIIWIIIINNNYNNYIKDKNINYFFSIIF